MMSCRICERVEDERNMQEQKGISLCRSCVDYYTDEELAEIIWGDDE